MDSGEKIKSLTPEHFSKICRICLSSEALRLIQETLVDSIEATDLFEYTIGVEFDKNDLMPHNMCDTCLATLYEMYKLKKQSLINELLFKTQIDYYKILQKEDLSRVNIVKREKEVEQDTKLLNGDIVNTVTTTEIEKLNNVKIEPVDYNLTLEDEKGIKTEGLPDLKNVSIGLRTPFPITTPVIYNSNNIENYVSNVDILPGLQVPVTSQLDLFNDENKSNLTTSVDLTTFTKPKRKRKQYKNKIPCSICKKLIAQRGMADHLITHQTQREVYQCDQCPRTLKTKNSLKIHKIQHSGMYPWKCLKCKKGFATAAHLKYHMVKCQKDKEEPKQFICKVCGQNFASRVAFGRHLTRHLVQKETDNQVINEYLKDCPFKCDVCLTSYESESSLKQHIKNSHSGTLFLCNICGKNLTSKCGLDKHIKSHRGEKAYACKVCPLSFISASTLKRHMVVHTDERPFKCSICLKRFKVVARLNNHLLLHKGDKPHQCTFCDKKFAAAGNLTKHTATHTGEKRYFCSVCNKGFYDKNIMTNHEVKHQTITNKNRKPITKDIDQAS